MDATQEQWRPVVGYEGSYEVSDHGRVRSLLRPRILRPATHKHGYQMVNLSSGPAGHRTQRVHKIDWLVLAAFVGPRPAGDTHSRHLNDNPEDNRLENLAWGTRSENYHDAVRNGLHRNAAKTHCKNGHEFTPENTSVSSRGRRCKACHNARNRVYNASAYTADRRRAKEQRRRERDHG